LAPFFKLYAVFINSHQDALEEYRKLASENSKFCKFTREHFDSTKLRISMLMEIPVLRLPQYLVYLGSLSIKLELEGYYDLNQEIDDAINSVKNTLDAIALQLRDKNAREAVIKAQIEVFKNSVCIVDPSRYMIKRGQLTMINLEKSFFQSAKEKVYLVLFNDMLIVATISGTVKKIFRLRILSAAPLSSQNSEVVSDNGIRISDGKTSLVFEASSDINIKSWIREISDAVELQQGSLVGSHITDEYFEKMILLKAPQVPLIDSSKLSLEISKKKSDLSKTTQFQKRELPNQVPSVRPSSQSNAFKLVESADHRRNNSATMRRPTKPPPSRKPIGQQSTAFPSKIPQNPTKISPLKQDFRDYQFENEYNNYEEFSSTQEAIGYQEIQSHDQYDYDQTNEYDHMSEYDSYESRLARSQTQAIPRAAERYKSPTKIPRSPLIEPEDEFVEDSAYYNMQDEEFNQVHHEYEINQDFSDSIDPEMTEMDLPIAPPAPQLPIIKQNNKHFGNFESANQKNRSYSTIDSRKLPPPPPPKSSKPIIKPDHMKKSLPVLNPKPIIKAHIQPKPVNNGSKSLSSPPIKERPLLKPKPPKREESFINSSSGKKLASTHNSNQGNPYEDGSFADESYQKPKSNYAKNNQKDYYEENQEDFNEKENPVETVHQKSKLNVNSQEKEISITSAKNTNSNGNDFLSQIRSGTTLRKVQPHEKSKAAGGTRTSNPSSKGGLQSLEAELAKSLAQYRKFVRSPEEEDDDEDDEFK
jgi:hypothetical protein